LKNRNEINKKVDLNAPLPDSWDWRDKGGVTEVKNQGMCGSCYSFSATGCIEGVHYAHTKQLVSVSEEQVIECDKLDQGCNGGFMDNVFNYTLHAGGLETEKDYPYEGYVKAKCHVNKTLPRITFDWYKDLSQNEKEIAQWVVQNGPVAIGINAFAMQYYIRGISHPWKIFCSPSALDHGVLIVGYGVAADKKQTPFWIVKNSWGPKWGRSGYYYVYRGAGTCGLNRMASTVGYN